MVVSAFRGTRGNDNVFTNAEGELGYRLELILTPSGDTSIQCIGGGSGLCKSLANGQVSGYLRQIPK